MTSIHWEAGPSAQIAPRRGLAERLTLGTLALSAVISFVVTIEPAPTDIVFVFAFLFWLCTDFRVHRSSLLIIGVMLIHLAAGFVALLPVLHVERALLYQIISFFLFMKLVFMTIFMSEDTERRMRFWLSAYAVGAVIGCTYGILGYMNLFGLAQYTLLYETRITGAFKDANVFAPYAVLPATYLLERVLSGKSKHTLLCAVSFFIIAVAIVLAFSRGAWGAFLVSCGMLYIGLYSTTTERALRRRILGITALVAALLVVAVTALLTLPNTAELLTSRTTLQEYDLGEGGRFTTQLRALGYIVDYPNGLGPFGYREFFGLDPHSSYINSFWTNGWVGGLVWICVAVSTAFIGFRLMFRASPYRRLAHIVFPPVFTALLQGFQIDIDHWRHVFLMIGAIWALEGARQRWAAAQSNARYV